MPDLDQDSLKVLVSTMKILINIMIRYLSSFSNNVCEITLYLSMLI